MGRITNPTVHIGLNQLRKVVNRLIKTYGKPTEIVVEIARDLSMSSKQLNAYNRDLQKKTAHREKIRTRLTKAGVEPTRDMVDLVRLWLEMPTAAGFAADDARLCVYTGTPITFAMLLNSEADVDHILPVSVTLDDSANNKVVCLKSSNRQKGNRAPADVTEWAADCDNTSKDRTDHRHHAIDAAIIGLVTPSLILDLSRLAKTVEADDVHRIVAKTYRLARPDERLRDQLRQLLDRMVVSHKSDKGTIDSARGLTSGGLHRDTSYGLGKDEDGKPKSVRRKLLLTMKPGDISLVRDPDLKHRLEMIAYDAGLLGANNADLSVEEKKTAEKEAEQSFRQGLANLQTNDNQYRGIRRVRTAETLSVIPITGPDGTAFKGYKGDSNDYADIWVLPNGKWKVSITSTFEAHHGDVSGNDNEIKRKYPTAKKKARLRKNDMVAYEVEGRTIYARVAKFSGGSVSVSEHHRSGTDDYDVLSATRMKESDFRVVIVNEIGHVFDPRQKRRTPDKI